MELKLLNGAAPFYFPGSPDNKIGVLCLHGLSATPQEVYWTGHYLNQQGWTVFAPRLYGHGADPDQMRRMRWQDWYLSVLDGYYLLRQNCDKVIALGLSTGGLLALRLAASESVAATIALATPILPPASNAWLSHVARYFVGYVAHYEQSNDPLDLYVRQQQQRRGEPVLGRVAAWKQSAAGVSELLKLAVEVRSTLAKVTVPTLLVYSERDETAHVANIDVIKQGMTNNQQVEVLRLKESGHVITSDVEYEKVNQQIGEFIRRVVL